VGEQRKPEKAGRCGRSGGVSRRRQHERRRRAREMTIVNGHLAVGQKRAIQPIERSEPIYD